MKKETWVMETKLANPYKLVNELHRGSFTMESHSHPFWQLILVTDGQLHIKANFPKRNSSACGGAANQPSSGTTVLCAGTIHILPPGWEHTLFSPGGYSQLGIDLYADSAEGGLVPLLERSFTQPSILTAEQSLSLASQISEQQRKGTPLSEVRMINLLDSLILCCAEALESTSSSFEEQLSAYLDANLDRPLRLSEVASYFYISVPQLERLCRRSYHCGVIELLKQRRFRKAQQLLISTELSVQEIGSVVGYPDPAHFSGFFRNQAGISPRAYRKQSRLYA